MAFKEIGYDFWKNVLHSPQFVAAPMVDMSELPFRELCRKYGAQLCFTPMLHSQQFVQDSLYRSDCFSTCLTDRPLVVQFCANNPDVFVKAASFVSSQCDAIDLNLGCPQAIAKKGRYGAFLQDDWDLVHSIIKKACSELTVPVTCKIRVMPGPSIRSVEYAKMLENAGCSVITVHGRNIYQKGHNTGLASWDIIRDIKDNVMIPVIANGNILSYSDLQKCLTYTHADAVMSAEALLHNPALFSGTNPPVWKIINEYLTLAEKYNTPLRHVRNHMYRILYLCLHQDSELRSLLENAGSYDDFYNIYENLKVLPSNQNLLNDASFDKTNLYSDTNEQLFIECDISDLFSSYHFSDCDNSENALNLSQIHQDAANVHFNCKNDLQEHTISDNGDLFSSDNKHISESATSYFPPWICHSRPRITVTGENRGCYSRYFGKEELKTNDQTNLSKRQQRRMRHYFRVLAAMKESRKAKKLRRKQKLLEIKENNCIEIQKVKVEEKITKKQQRDAIRQRLLDAQNNAPKIVIDLGYSSEMSEKDLNRLSTQLRRLYGSNRHSLKPFHLFFCNIHDSDPFFKICASKNDGFSSYVVDMIDKSPETLFMPDELIYLSPDSENILEKIEPDKVYVIGGILDNSVKKGLSLCHAESINIKSCRLPVLEYFERTGHTSGNTVLTVNQVFDILLKFHETNDWVKALSAGVPSRKGFRVKTQSQINETDLSNIKEEQITETQEK